MILLLLLNICAGREFQIFTILLKKMSFASFDLEAIVTSDACEIGKYIVIYVNIVHEAAENPK